MATSFAVSGPGGPFPSSEDHGPPMHAVAFPEGDAWTADGVGVDWAGTEADGPSPAAVGLAAGVGLALGVGVVAPVGLGVLDVAGTGVVPQAAWRRAATFAAACALLSTTMPARTESRSAGGRSTTRTPVVWSRLARSIGPRFCGSPRNTATWSPSTPTKYCCRTQCQAVKAPPATTSASTATPASRTARRP